MSNRPDIELALDVRSYERVILISGRDSVRQYPEAWFRPTTLAQMLSLVGPESVVLVDSAEVTRRTYGAVGERCPRLLAVVTPTEEHARSIRRAVSSLYPWSELYGIVTCVGRIAVVQHLAGRPYDRDRVIDMRPGVVA